MLLFLIVSYCSLVLEQSDAINISTSVNTLSAIVCSHKKWLPGIITIQDWVLKSFWERTSANALHATKTQHFQMMPPFLLSHFELPHLKRARLHQKIKLKKSSCDPPISVKTPTGLRYSSCQPDCWRNQPFTDNYHQTLPLNFTSTQPIYNLFLDHRDN